MKIRWIIAFVFCTIFPNLHPHQLYSQDLLPKGSHVDFYAGLNAHGGKVVLPSTEFRFYQSNKDESCNFGFYWHTDKFVKQLPWVIKAGNLTPAGLYSKIKNPLLSSSLSPFSSVSSEATGLTANLPSYNTFSRSSSYYIQGGYSNSKTVLQELLISYWNSQNEDIQVLSAKIKISPTKKLSFALSGCSGYFDYGTNHSNSWFTEELFYHNGTHFCGISQLSVSLPSFSSLFTLGTFQSPFGSFQNLYRLESKYKSNHFIFSFSSAFVPDEILTGDDKQEKSLLQLKGSLQYKYITGLKQPVGIKTGIAFLSKTNFQEETTSLKLASGIQISSSLYSLAVLTLINTNLIVPDAGTSQLTLKSGELSLKNSWYFQTFCPSIGMSETLTPSSDYSSLTTSTSWEFIYHFTDNPNISDKYKYTIQIKNNLPVKRTLSNSIILKTKIRQLSFTGSISLSMEF